MAKTRAEPNKPESQINTKKKKSKRMKSLLSSRGAPLKEEERENPFETIWSRRKFDVLGKKRKGEERRIGLSRSLAIEKREKTLLKEFEHSRKSSVFHDKRIGEHDDSLREYEKAILRLQKERLSKLKRKNKYNLSDEEEETERDDFEEFLPPDEDGADGEGEFHNLEMKNQSDSMDASLSEGTEQSHKSKRQVMSEIIEKSKFYKAQKAKDKEEDEQLMEKLDQDFASLAQTEALRTLTQPSKICSLNSLLINNSNTVPARVEKSSASKTADLSLIKEKPDAYDKLVKEMVMESRARPSDRVKTPEEIAREERERLEQLEEERQKRMLAPDEDSSDESDGDAERNVSKKLRSASGDDIGDPFLLDEEEPTDKTGWVDSIISNQKADDPDDNDSSASDEEEEEDGEEEFEKNMTVKDWEQSDEDELITDPEQMHDVNEKDRKKKEGKIGETVGRKEGVEGLPFVIEAPNNLKDLCSLLDDRSENEVVEAINRIRACNSIRLGADNRKKMQVFYGLLLQYFALLASRSPLKMTIVNSLVKPLIEMSAETPYFAAICARERLIHTRTQFCEDIKIPGKCSWPSLKTLVLMRLWSLKFPCSDFRHAVMTPMLLLMSEYLMRCPIQSARDLAVGSFLCSMLLSAIKQSKKYCSEAVMFLQTLLLSGINLDQGFQIPLQLSQLAELRAVKPLLCINNKECEVKRINLLSIVEIQPDSPFLSSDEFKASIILSASEALMGFIQVYEDLSTFPEIFHSISVLLHTILEKYELPSLLRGNLQDCMDLIKSKTTEHNNLRLPLQMHKKKPEPIKLMNPKFEENFVKGVDYDPDRERVKQKRLLRKIKSEEKGSRRELRKDKDFLLHVKEKKRREEEAERAERSGKNWAFLQEQEHAFKSGQLGKGRKRRR